MRKNAFFIILLTFLAYSLWGISDEARLYNEAERRYRKGDYQFALSRYEKIIREYPSSEYTADAHFRTGVIYFRKGKVDKAIEILERVRSRYAYTNFSSYVPFWLGVSYYTAEKYGDALTSLTGFLDKGGKNYREDALLYATLCRRRLDRSEEALDTAEKLIDKTGSPSENPEAYRLYIALLVENEEYEKVLSVTDQMQLENVPSDLKSTVWLYIAEAKRYLGMAKEAEKLYEKVLEASSVRTSDGKSDSEQSRTEIVRIAYQRLFKMYLDSGRDEEAEIVLENAQSSLAGYPELLNDFFLRAGVARYESGQYELAESYLRRVYRSVSKEQVDPIVPLYLSASLENIDGLENAFSLVSEYISEIPENRLRSERGESLFFNAIRYTTKMERWGDAESYSERYTTLFPNGARSAEVSYLYAYALGTQEREREALAVLSDMSRKREERSLYSDILALRSALLMELDRYSEAEESLREYLPLNPKDPRARYDLVRIAFSTKRWEEVVERTNDAEKSIEEFAGRYPEIAYKTAYLGGLAKFGMGRFEEGASELEELLGIETISAPVREKLEPHLLFFLGWARYKTAEYSAAVQRFDELEKRYPAHGRVQESRYLSGWSAYASESYSRAEEAFAEYARYAEKEGERMKGLYMYAKSLAEGEKRKEAQSVYRQIFEEGKNSGIADEALFEYASLLAEEGRTNEAVRTFKRLYKEYPRSSLAEEALFRRGELLENEERYEKAREAYYEHRSRFPEGDLLDVSLYHGAVTAKKNGELYGAALLLERLVEEYPDSAFHSQGLKELAELYDETGAYEKAVQYYSRFRSLYPEEAKRFSIARRIKTIKEIMEGKSPKEAELSVRVEENGLDFDEGRSAAVQLAGIYLSRYGENREKLHERALSLLESVLEYKEEDPDNAASAYYQQGEYHRREGRYEEAAKRYADAAVTAREEDLTARSMYMAAESAVKAEKKSDARSMINKLESNFPDSGWAVEGRRLIDEDDD